MENINTSTKVTSGDNFSVDSTLMLPLVVSWTVMGVVSTILNALVCIVVWQNKRLWTTTNTFLVSLSIADLLIAAVFIPTYIFEEFSETTYPISGYLIAFLLLASISNLGAVTYERYVALTRPLCYRSIMSHRKVTEIITLAWLLPLLTALLPLAWQADSATLTHKVYLLVVIFGCVLLPCITMVYIYTRLLRVVRRFIRRNRRRSTSGNKTGERAGREEKAARVFALIFASFLLCWLPLIYINICQALELHQLITAPILYVSFYTLVFNTALDPFIYAFLKRDIRRSLTKCCCRKGEPNGHAELLSGNLTANQTKGETVV